MHKLNVATLLFIVLIAFQSCQIREKSESGNQDKDLIYTISLEKALGEPLQSAFLSEIGGNISYIPLEANENSIFNGIGRVIIQDSSIFLSANRNKLLLQFDISGKYVRQIGRQGQGPEDYRWVSDFFVQDSIRCIYSFQKFLIYNDMGVFVKSMPLDMLPRQMLLMKDQNIVFRFGPGLVDTSAMIMCITDPDFNVLRTFRNNHKRDIGGNVFPIEILPMYTFQGAIRFKELGVDTLYTVTADGLIPYALFVLGQRELPSVLNIRTASTSEIESMNSGKASLSQIFEDPKHFYMRFNFFSMREGTVPGAENSVVSVSGPVDSYIYGLYSKETAVIKIFNKSGFQNDIDGGLPFFTRYVYNDSILVDWVEAYKLREQVLNADATEMQKKYGQKFDDLVKLAKGLKDDGGTVLVLVRP